MGNKGSKRKSKAAQDQQAPQFESNSMESHSATATKPQKVENMQAKKPQSAQADTATLAIESANYNTGNSSMSPPTQQQNNDDNDLGPTPEFRNLKAMADEKLEEGLSMRGVENLEQRTAIQDAIGVYEAALELPGIDSECKLQVYRQMLKAYNKQEQLSGLKQLKIYYFDLELETIDHILYYSKNLNSSEVLELVGRGQSYFARLRLVLAGETSENKAGYLEKIFVGMNAENMDFRCRLAWTISKAYYKQALQQVDAKQVMKANTLVSKAQQYLRMYEETLERYNRKHPQPLSFKSQAKCTDFFDRLNKLSFQMRAEMQILAGERTLEHATMVDENLNMDEIYDALDEFGNASKLAFEQQDIEMEARCEAAMGKVYDKALKKESKAMSHYNSVVRLAASLAPRNVSNEPWFKQAKERLDAIREKRRLDEESAKDRADKPFRDMITEDLKKVKDKAAEGCKPFLQYVNEHYAPADKKIALTDEMLAADKLKRTMTIKFSKIFHPDKNVNEARQVQILREEIMRNINIFVEEYK